jgi:sterol desaturase/sphingolipid hydroxylase (fatty acid hydroxylase superfamily)
MEMIHWFTDGFGAVQAWLFQTFLAPLVHALGLSMFMENAFDATEWFMLGAIEVSLLYLLLRPLEKWRPAEPEQDGPERRRAIRTDLIYTLLHRLGGFALLVFFVLDPVADAIEAELRLNDIPRFSLDTLAPWLAGHALAQFLAYLVILDFADYWIHRGQHRIGKWWALHSLHHSQRHMTLWSDNRNHLLDDLIHDGLMAMLALLIGVEPGQFVGLVIASRMVQSLQHANVRLRFGAARFVLVSPQFHRLHHAMGAGHEGPQFGCNFGVLFPWWDLMFGSADFANSYQPTGVRDQLTGREYGRGFWSQQWLGLKRLVNRA